MNFVFVASVDIIVKNVVVIVSEFLIVIKTVKSYT